MGSRVLRHIARDTGNVEELRQAQDEMQPNSSHLQESQNEEPRGCDQAARVENTQQSQLGHNLFFSHLM